MRSSDREGPTYSQVTITSAPTLFDIPVRARTHGSYSLRSHNASTTLSSFSGLIDGGTLPCTTPCNEGARFNESYHEPSSTYEGRNCPIENNSRPVSVSTVLLADRSIQFFQNSPRGIPRERCRACSIENYQFFFIFSFIDPNCTVEFHSPNESVAIVPMIYIFKDFFARIIRSFLLATTLRSLFMSIYISNSIISNRKFTHTAEFTQNFERKEYTYPTDRTERNVKVNPWIGGGRRRIYTRWIYPDDRFHAKSMGHRSRKTFVDAQTSGHAAASHNTLSSVSCNSKERQYPRAPSIHRYRSNMGKIIPESEPRMIKKTRLWNFTRGNAWRENRDRAFCLSNDCSSYLTGTTGNTWRFRDGFREIRGNEECFIFLKEGRAVARD